MLAIGLAMDFGLVQRVHVLKQLEPDFLEPGKRPVMGKYPAAVTERMGVFDADGSDRCPANMCHGGMGVYPCRRLCEMLPLEGCPSLLHDYGHTIRIIRDTPAVAMHQALHITPALRHERVLGANKPALHPGRLVRSHGVEATHAEPFPFTDLWI